ncbi:MAG: hypothetical protein J2O48_09230, partial [Solirubrobacterales bacterium]|nr:hypothetical protein [Solirubrobacterales bacterium]
MGLPDDTQWITGELRRVAASERAPEQLHAQITDLEQKAARRERKSTGRGWAGGLAAGVAVLAGVLLLVVPWSSSTVGTAAQLGAKRAVRFAPGPDPRAPEFLSAHVGDLSFPNWSRSAGWRAIGARDDSLDNHAILTIDYRRGSQQVAYSIVTSPVLKGQQTGYHSFTQGQRTVVSWSQRGHSC